MISLYREEQAVERTPQMRLHPCFLRYPFGDQGLPDNRTGAKLDEEPTPNAERLLQPVLCLVPPWNIWEIEEFKRLGGSLCAPRNSAS